MTMTVAEPASTAALSGTQKAALVLMQIGRERAAKILSRLDESTIEELTAEIVRMERVDRAVADSVIGEFHSLTLGGSQQISNGGLGYAQQLLEASVGS